MRLANHLPVSAPATAPARYPHGLKVFWTPVRLAALANFHANHLQRQEPQPRPENVNSCLLAAP